MLFKKALDFSTGPQKNVNFSRALLISWDLSPFPSSSLKVSAVKTSSDRLLGRGGSGFCWFSLQDDVMLFPPNTLATVIGM